MKGDGRLTIPMWSEGDRPREKMLHHGSTAMSDAELIAILLRSGTPEESALDLAKRLLAANENSLDKLMTMSTEALTKINGIGTVKALTLQAAFELGKRQKTEPLPARKKIKSADDVLELLQNRLGSLKHEEFWCVFLNHGNVVLKMENIGKGGITSTIVDVRLIMQPALEVGATRLILCHNHPSGEVEPSNLDIQLTDQITSAARLFNIEILDHLIVSKYKAYSFHANGLV